ncbi:hypothetical protein TrVE_jg5302 [Triparma verrucosa]|uniref:AB hydrolase-1 domain-containing protein n=1 Tax=Triparma verrucosa TaxID=1606542 RepID=A0A9W7ELS1_9STRA|nr:hypothetical protein TrVE_jg5302 [Triparma verrucosa]
MIRLTRIHYLNFRNNILTKTVPTSSSPSGSTTVTYLHVPPPSPSPYPPLILLHGFDSSSLEYRRLLPLLSTLSLEAYAVDVPGWGFGDLTLKKFSASVKIEVINSFVSQLKPDGNVVYVGASLGGAVALNLSASEKKPLILLDAQGFTDGVGPQPPAMFLGLGLDVLKARWLRRYANVLSYYDDEKFATEDAITIGCLHTRREGWKEAQRSFIMSGGFEPTKDVKKVGENGGETLVIWGEEDEVLPKDFPDMFKEKIPQATIKYVKECGHVPHLEKSEETAAAILEFVKGLKK